MDPSGRLCRGESVKRVVRDRVTGFINKTNACLIMFDGNSMGTLRSDDGDGNENGKKAIDFTSLHMTPVDRDDPDDPG